MHRVRLPIKIQFHHRGVSWLSFPLSSHLYCFHVIQCMFKLCLNDQTWPILEEHHKGTCQLVRDLYENYVIQQVLERGLPDDKSWIIFSLLGQVSQLNAHKFTSKVMEKAIANARLSECASLVDEIHGPGSGVILKTDSCTVVCSTGGSSSSGWAMTTANSCHLV